MAIRVGMEVARVVAAKEVATAGEEATVEEVAHLVASMVVVARQVATSEVEV